MPMFSALSATARLVKMRWIFMPLQARKLRFSIFFSLYLDNPLAYRTRKNKLLLPTPSPPPPDFRYYQNHPKINTYEDETPLQKTAFSGFVSGNHLGPSISLCVKPDWLNAEETIPISVQWQWLDNFCIKLGSQQISFSFASDLFKVFWVISCLSIIVNRCVSTKKWACFQHQCIKA